MPAADPGLARGTYLAMAITATVAFFACSVLHELGHAPKPVEVALRPNA